MDHKNNTMTPTKQKLTRRKTTLEMGLWYIEISWNNLGRNYQRWTYYYRWEVEEITRQEITSMFWFSCQLFGRFSWSNENLIKPYHWSKNGICSLSNNNLHFNISSCYYQLKNNLQKQLSSKNKRYPYWEWRPIARVY